MKDFLKISAFVLIIVGTAGLLLNEFVWQHSSTRTVIFAVVNFVGLVNLGFVSFALKDRPDA
jgi:O-antigen ligase